MNKPLSEHVSHLEGKIVVLRKQLRDADLPLFQRTEQELELANAVEALRLFRRAYELERGI